MIVDPDGRPIADATVAVLKGELTIDQQQSKKDGTFAFNSLGAGTYQVHIEATGFRSAYYSVTLYRPANSYKRSLRIELAVGAAWGCHGNISVAKHPLANN